MSVAAPASDVLDLGALAVMFGMTRSGARRALLRGDLGPFFTVGRRLFVRRAAMLAAVQAREVSPEPRPEPLPVPVAPEWARDLLRRGGRRK